MPDPVFTDPRIAAAVEAGFLIPRTRLETALEVLGINDPSSVAAVQIDTDLQVTVVRRRADVKGRRLVERLVREHAYFTPKETP